jgi:hypothetical protein
VCANKGLSGKLDSVETPSGGPWLFQAPIFSSEPCVLALRAFPAFCIFPDPKSAL